MPQKHVQIVPSFVARAGFEPAICWLRTNRPRPLDERALCHDFIMVVLDRTSEISLQYSCPTRTYSERSLGSFEGRFFLMC